MKPKRHSERPDGGNAFIPDMTDISSHGSHGMTAKAADAEFFGEEFIGSATTGESMSEDVRDEVGDEEDGGPYLLLGEDGSLPLDEEGDVLTSSTADVNETLHQAQTRGANWMARGA